MSTLFEPPMGDFLQTVRHRLVVVGSVARRIREPGFIQPKDLDLLCDLDSKLARKEIQTAVERLKLKYESPFAACWTFRDYGWMVEILATHHGPDYRVVRRRANQIDIGGITFWVAQSEDAPTKKESRS